MMLMQLIAALILGVTQGLTEFIPVSSSGHLILMERLLGFSGGLAFDVALHLGTLLALVLFFGSEFGHLIQAGLRRSGPERRLLTWLAIATVPGVILGTLLESKAETVFRSPNLVAVNLIIIGAVMLLADRWARRHRHLGQMAAADAGTIGLAQALAVVPGVSRSGITISAGLGLGFDRVDATKFSFWLSGPIIFGAVMKIALTGSSLHEVSAQPGIFAVGVVASLISGYLAIRFMLSYLTRHGLALFSYYRFAVGALVLIIGMRK